MADLAEFTLRQRSSSTWPELHVKLSANKYTLVKYFHTFPITVSEPTPAKHLAGVGSAAVSNLRYYPDNDPSVSMIYRRDSIRTATVA